MDDEPMIGRGIARLLGRDHEVAYVGSAAEAIAALEADSSFTLVMSDVLMPGKSGMDLFEEVGRRWPALQPRMLFLTGGASNDASRRFIDQLADKCIMKPFSGDALRSAVAKAI